MKQEDALLSRNKNAVIDGGAAIGGAVARSSGPAPLPKFLWCWRVTSRDCWELKGESDSPLVISGRALYGPGVQGSDVDNLNAPSRHLN
jgi:hypothetical protein